MMFSLQFVHLAYRRHVASVCSGYYIYVDPFPHFFLLRSLPVSTVIFHKMYVYMRYNSKEFSVRLILLLDFHQTLKMLSHFSENVQRKATLKSRSGPPIRK